jgi:hypothetical protein
MGSPFSLLSRKEKAFEGQIPPYMQRSKPVDAVIGTKHRAFESNLDALLVDALRRHSNQTSMLYSSAGSSSPSGWESSSGLDSGSGSGSRDTKGEHPCLPV